MNIRQSSRSCRFALTVRSRHAAAAFVGDARTEAAAAIVRWRGSDEKDDDAEHEFHVECCSQFLGVEEAAASGSDSANTTPNQRAVNTIKRRSACSNSAPLPCDCIPALFQKSFTSPPYPMHLICTSNTLQIKFQALTLFKLYPLLPRPPHRLVPAILCRHLNLPVLFARLRGLCFLGRLSRTDGASACLRCCIRGMFRCRRWLQRGSCVRGHAEKYPLNCLKCGVGVSHCMRACCFC